MVAVAIACHCSNSAADHLGDVSSHNGKESPLENLKLHQTKYSQLLTNVIAPDTEKTPKNAVQDQKLAMIADESTDVTSEKHLCVCVLP